MMNRLQTLSSVLEPAIRPHASSSGKAGAGLYSSARGESPCAFFAPLHYEANYAYPLLVWLHGPSDDEGQLKRIMPLVSIRNYVGVSLRGSLRMEKQDGRRGYGWSQTRGDVALAEQRLFEAVELARRRYNIAPERVFLAGFDCGGTMAFRLAMNHPSRFRGVLSLCGGFPTGRRPLWRLAEARRLPLFLATGRDSAKYKEADACEDLKLIHSAGMSISLRQYPCGHQITSLMLSDMDRWMMEQITGTSANTA
jgi:phospholipase/carboxylesterase